MTPSDNPDQSPNRPGDSSISLTPSEQRLLRDAARFRVTLCFAFVILAVVCHVWLTHFSRFTTNRFFLAYNIAVYVGLVWAAFYTASYQRRVHRLLQRLIHTNTSGSQ
jgi:hypothetical protein